jgi:hypothetical protein
MLAALAYRCYIRAAVATGLRPALMSGAFSVPALDLISPFIDTRT